MIDRRQQRKGHLALFSSNVMWGVMAPISKSLLAAGVISATALTDMRLLGGTILFWILSIIVKSDKVEKKDYIKICGAAFFSTALNQILFVNGVSLTSPVDASICTSTLPIWTMLMAAVVLKEPMTGQKIAGVALGLAGAVLLILFGSVRASGGSSNILGDMLCLGSQMSYSVYLVFYQSIIRKYSPLTLMKWKYLFGAMMLLPSSIGVLPGVSWSQFSLENWGSLAYVILFGTFLSYLIVPIGQKTLRPTVVAMYNYLQPISAATVAILCGLDSFSPAKVVAVVLIFSGVMLVNRSRAA